MKYKSEIIKSMNYLALKKNTIFLGQSVSIPGNLIYGTLKNIPKSKKLELPVFEETQMGISIGLSLNGFIPVTCYPRFDFFILSLNKKSKSIPNINKINGILFPAKSIPAPKTQIMTGGKINFV